jgi:hypothetical protein
MSRTICGMPARRAATDHRGANPDVEETITAWNRQAGAVRRSHSTPAWIAPVATALLMCAACGSDATSDAADPATMASTDAESTDPTPSGPATTNVVSDPNLEEPTPVSDTTPPTDRTPTDSTGSAPDTDDVTMPDPDCRRLTDFDGAGAGEWSVVNDGVMGGRSNGTLEISDSVMRFTGSVVTAGGGFTSVRLRLDGTELAATTRVELRIRADQRTYGLTMEDDAQVGRRSVSHRANFPSAPPADDDGWSTISIPYADLRPSVFGQPVDAPPFNPDQAREFGIIIADGVDGDFALDVDWIDACVP